MRNYEAEMSHEELEEAKNLLQELGIKDAVTVNEMLNEIARISGRYEGNVTFEKKVTA